MSENTFNPLEINLQTQPLPTYIDADGSFKLNTPMLSSFDFDGLIPKFDGNINAIDVKPGYMIQAVTGEYFPVISVEYDEDDMEDVPSGIVTINYLDDQGNIVSVDYDEADSVAVVYEDWDEKSLGTQGWGITAGGNAIFTNVAVRGRIEAEEGYISGNLTIGSGGSTTLDDVATADDLTDFITGPEVNTNVTSISGGVITTGRIKNSTYDGPVSGGGSFSNTGSQFNIDDGSIVTPNFRVSSAGDASFRGSIFTRDITIDAVDTANTGYIVGSEIPIIGGPVSNIALSYYSGKGTFSHNGVSWTVDNDVNVTSLLRDQLYAYSGSNPFRSFLLRSGSLRNNNTGTTIDGAEIDLTTRDTGSRLVLNADSIQSLGNYLHSGALVVLPSGTALGSYPAGGTVKATYFEGDGSGLTNLPAPANVVLTTNSYSNPSWITSLAGSKITGNISGNASNITSYNINQNVGTGNSPTFAGLTVSGATFIPNAYTQVVSNRVVNVNSSGRLGNPSSSYLIKKNISPISEPDFKFYNIVPNNKIIEKNVSSYKKILDLTPVEFEWDIDDQTPGPEFGLIAEEIVEKMPGSSLPGDENVPAYYKITSLFAALLGVVKDQQKTIEDLESRVIQLESQLGG